MLDNTLESASDGGKAFEVVNSLSKGSERLVGLTKGGQLPSDLLQSSAKFQHNGEMKTLAELYEVINGANSQISSASKNDAVIIVFNEIFDLGDSVGGVTKTNIQKKISKLIMSDQSSKDREILNELYMILVSTNSIPR